MKTAVVIFWEGYLDVAPTVVEWIRFLAAKGIKVRVYISDPKGRRSEVSKSFDSRMIEVENIPVNTGISRFAGELVNNRFVWRIFPALVKVVNDGIVAESIRKFVERLGKDQQVYEVAYCLDATGLYAFKHSGIKAGRLVNISLEILEPERVQGKMMREIKETETEMLKKEVDRVVIQDAYRGVVLERSLGYELNIFSYLPNSAIKENLPKERGYYFHDLFNIDKRQKIVLSAGMIADSVCSLDLSKVIGAWETDLPVKVVFHERLEIPENAGYYNKVRQAGQGKVYLSLKPVPFDEVYKLFSSAHIGLAIYSKSHGDNFGVIGSASGKLFQYIKYGIPVIASNLPGLRELVLENEMGLVVDEPEQVPSAIEDLIRNWGVYSNNARKAFNERLNMDVFLDRVYQTIYH